jgi:hypothetical protein
MEIPRRALSSSSLVRHSKVAGAVAMDVHGTSAGRGSTYVLECCTSSSSSDGGFGLLGVLGGILFLLASMVRANT